MIVPPLDALLLALACYRLTRLVMRDHITHALREHILEPLLTRSEQHRYQRREPDPDSALGYSNRFVEHYPSRLDQLGGWLAFLVSCPWCLSVWLSGALCGAYATWPDPTRTLCLILAVAAVAGLLLDRDHS